MKKGSKIYLNELPKFKKDGVKISWEKSVGHDVKFTYDGIDGYVTILEYIWDGKKAKLKIKYENKEFILVVVDFQKCRLGALFGKKVTSDFKIDIGTHLKDEKRDLIVLDRKYIKKKDGYSKKCYKYHCNKCGFNGGTHWNLRNKEYKSELWVEESQLLVKRSGCSCCCNNPRIVAKGINDIATTNPWMVKYFKNIEDVYTHTYSSIEKLQMACPECRAEKMMTPDKLYNWGFGCPRCGDGASYPEKFMFNLLEQLDINFIPQFNVTNANWCGKYKYDFYFELNNEKYIIETHGEQHYRDTVKFSKSLAENKENDKRKKDLAFKNGVKKENYIVINCYRSEISWMKNNIINSKLKELFDLSKVDWNKVLENSSNSLIRKVCDYKRDNPNIKTKALCEKMKLKSDTIIKYLKMGNELGWCNYEAVKNIKVEIYKDNKYLGVFDSLSSLIQQSKKLFGIKLSYKIIHRIIDENIEYEGYIIKKI
ncbi:hypothetical protein AB2T90_11175 [Clostridium butyricum]|uniref:hypothetical protein n=1 Tax=Clostridium butyricum TaxID=1492 RepID=UPI003465DCBD